MPSLITGIRYSLFNLVLICLLWQTTSAQQVSSDVDLPALQTGFFLPPDSIQTSVYWYWISDNISKEGVIKDLHAMKSVGINRAFIGNIGLDETPYGKVKIFTDEWWEIMHAALKTATELNIEIGIFNSPGWSQSGGPWIRPEQAMRYMISSKIMVSGPAQITQKLPAPIDSFQDVRVIAFPAPKNFRKTISAFNPSIASSPAVDQISRVLDENPATDILFPAVPEFSITISTKDSFTARSIVIYPAHRQMKLLGEIQVQTGTGFQKVKDFKVDRSNSALNTGFDPYGPVAISIPATTSTSFRLVFLDTKAGDGIVEILIKTDPTVENYIEKTLAKMHPVPLPYWKEYQWPAQPEYHDPAGVVDPASVLNISSYLSTDGTLNWKAPAGDWIVLRTGMTPTRVHNSPASPEGTGLEVDKMNKQHVAEHFNAFLGKIQNRIPVSDWATWKVVVEDSYETGGQNWTDGFIANFKSIYGYDPTAYLPVFRGIVVGSEDKSDRFLWDLRRLIADKVAYDYVGGLRDVSHAHGLHTWLENYGHWGFPGEFLQYGGQSDEIAGEFWSEGELGNIENRAASSCAHIYGKGKVSAESFTAGGKAFARYPAVMKQRGDRFFTEGINNTLLHVYIEQPDERQPGVNAGFGNEFNRHNTWFSQLDLFTSYIKRCNLMLQQGHYVADVAYFIGEDAPKMTGICDPALPKGYSFDYINAEVIEKRLAVVNGKWHLPDGLSYNILVLPKLQTMRPALLRKLLAFVQQGGVLMGPAPNRSPSLQDYGKADAEVKDMAGKLWGNINGTTVTTHKFGKGMVIQGMDMQQALDFLHIIPDFATKQDSVLFIHRTTLKQEIYFVSNQSDLPVECTPAFRTNGKSPAYWDAVNGTIRKLPAYRQQGSSTEVPLKLDAFQSAFIVFGKTDGTIRGPESCSMESGYLNNFPTPISSEEITSPWTVVFDISKNGRVNPIVMSRLTDWSQSSDDSIKNYSGTAQYKNNFHLDAIQTGEHVFLDLGMVKSMAKIKVNGIYAGGVWTAPYKIDISKIVRSGTNELEIEVVNTWVNRLIGDSKLPPEQRKTWSSINLYKPDSPYEPSGLLGPVHVEIVKYKD